MKSVICSNLQQFSLCYFAIFHITKISLNFILPAYPYHNSAWRSGDEGESCYGNQNSFIKTHFRILQTDTLTIYFDKVTRSAEIQAFGRSGRHFWRDWNGRGMYKQVQIIQHMVWYFVPTYYFYSQYNTKNTYFNIAHMYTSFRTVGRYVPTLCCLGMYYNMYDTCVRAILTCWTQSACWVHNRCCHVE